jgi:small membrane protein
MTWFQWIAVPLLILLAIVSGAITARRKISLASGTFWTALWLAAALAVARPDLTLLAAHLLGIGRGADLVFYCAILAASIAFFLIFVRLRRLDEQLTELVRQMALSAPMPPEGEEKSDSHES